MRIWVTRTAPDAEATAARLRTLGHAPLVAPLLEVRASGAASPSLDGVGALAFTSRNGVTAFASVCAERGLPVFAVGEATARAARGAGFGEVQSADGDVQALAALIANRRERFTGALLHPGAHEPADDLPGALKALGINARAHPMYRTDPATLPLAVTAALAARPVELDGVLVHSARAAECLAALPELQRAAQSITAFCISPAAAAPLRSLDLRSVAIAPQPDETALLNLLSS